ncbi:MAG: hypothetical protein WBB23_04525 [Desulforhopalus sp.]
MSRFFPGSIPWRNPYDLSGAEHYVHDKCGIARLWLLRGRTNREEHQSLKNFWKQLLNLSKQSCQIVQKSIV